MSEEDFLGRWSRRKHEARREGPPAGTPAPDPAAEVARSDVPADDQVPAGETPPDGGVDLSSLPPLDSITAVTDVTAFLREGVPLELSRAALRRAWSADPAIRDFVGLAENAWDFNDPNAMPGFGPLDCSDDELRGLVAKVIGDTQRGAEDLVSHASGQEDGSHSEHFEISSGAELPSDPAANIAAAQGEAAGATSGQLAPDAAAQSGGAGDAKAEAVRVTRRDHGGALPS